MKSRTKLLIGSIVFGLMLGAGTVFGLAVSTITANGSQVDLATLLAYLNSPTLPSAATFSTLSGNPASTTTGNGGSINILSGAGGTTSGNSGSITIETAGVTSGTVGNLILGTNSLAVMTLDKNGHVFTSAGGLQTAAPVASACGSTPTVVGNDSAFLLTTGIATTITTCSVTFNKSWGTAPHCFVADETSAIDLKTVPYTTGILLQAIATIQTGTQIDVMCVGHAT